MEEEPMDQNTASVVFEACHILYGTQSIQETYKTLDELGEGDTIRKALGDWILK